MRCSRCNATIVFRDDWPACHCDAIPGLMLTVREAAHFMSMSRGGIYHWIEAGLITANRSQRPIRIAMTSLKAFWSAEHVAWETSGHVAYDSRDSRPESRPHAGPGTWGDRRRHHHYSR